MIKKSRQTFKNGNLFFFLSEFSFTDTDNSRDSRGREETIFYSTLPLPTAHEHSDIYLQLCTWDGYAISCDSHRNACIYQTATRLNLPPYRITIWLINDVILTFVYLLVELILDFITAMWHWKPVDYHRNRIDYHPCIRSEPTNKCASHLRIKRSFKMKQEKR